MPAPPPALTERLTRCLAALCAQPSPAGQAEDLRATADLIAALLRGQGMEVRLVATPGAPLLLARRAGRSPRTLLLYHRYDTAPPGPWRAWSHEPYQLAEREGALYGRGVADSKGPLAAHIQAIQGLLEAHGELPCGVVIVAEGEGLAGSPNLAAALADHADLLRADLCLGSAGERAADGAPICYSGSKGMLQVRLSARGLAHPLPAGLASSLRNPLWRIVWALGSIKGDDEDVRLPGFYEGVEGPSREENATLRRVSFDEPGRLAAWGAPEFLFGMSGVALTRAESTLPTCNLSALSCEPSGELPLLPASATAVLDFQLVPRQEPAAVLALLRAHLAERGFADIEVEALPGGYPPAHSPPDEPAVALAAAAGAAIYGAPLTVVPAGPFALPLQPIAAIAGAPAVSIGLARPESAPLGPDEQIPVADLARHAQLLGELLCGLAAAS